MGARALSIPLAVAVHGLVTRLLGPSEAGIYFLAMSIVVVLLPVAHFGFQRAVVKFISESLAKNRTDLTRSVVGRSAMLALLTGSLSAALLASPLGSKAIGSVLRTPELRAVGWLLALQLLLRSSNLVSTEMLRGFHDLRRAAILGGPDANLVAAVLLAGAWVTGGGSSSLMVVLGAVAVAWVPGFSIGVTNLARIVREFPRGETVGLRRLMAAAWPMMLTAIAAFALEHADLWVVGRSLGQDHSALYGATLRVAALIIVPLVAANAVVMPAIGSLSARGRLSDLTTLLRTASTVAAIGAAVPLAVFMFLPGHVLDIVFGPFYRDASMILAILAIGQFAHVWGGSCGTVLLLTGHERLLLGITACAGFGMVSVASLVVDAFGMVGVAVVSASATIIYNVVMVIVVQRLVGVRTTAGASWIPEAIRFLWEMRRG